MPPSRRSRLRRAVVAGATVLLVGPLSTTQATAEEGPAADTLVGEVVRAWAEPQSPERATALHAEPLTWVEPVRGDAVRLPSDQAEELPVGATVEVQVGEEVIDEAAATGAVEPARELLEAEVVTAAATPVRASAVHQVTVALVATAESAIPAPGDLPDDLHTAAEFAAVVAGPVADFWAQESDGAIQLEVAAVDADNEWHRSTVSCADPTALWNETASRVGFVPGPSKHLLLYLPEEADPRTAPYDPCSYGFGTVGTTRTSGGLAWVRDDIPSVIAHELGHNFSLGHSSLKHCDNAIEEPADCGYFDYFDLYDVMGVSWPNIGSLSALHARRIGVLPLERVHQVGVTAPTRDYVLSPISSRTGHAGIRLAWGDLVYWLEYRTATGQDAWLGAPASNGSTGSYEHPLESGVLLRMEESAYGDTSLLLDGTPSPASGWADDLATSLPAGRSYWLAGGTFHVTVKGTTASEAVVRVSTAAGAPLPRDLSGDYAGDVVAMDRAGSLYTYRASATGGFQRSRTVSARGWQSRDLITTAGDWDGDGAHDVITRDRRNGDLWLYRGNNRSGFAGWRVIGRGWNGFSALLAPGDWNGDGFWDLIARRRSDGALMLYPGNGRGGFRAGGTRIGNGWNVMTGFAASGDWDSNGTVDFIARRRDGVLFLYQGNGAGGFAGAPRVIGRGWQIFTGLTGPGDWDGDGDSDLLARRTDGSLWLYEGAGTGGFDRARRIGAGWGPFRLGS